MDKDRHTVGAIAIALGDRVKLYNHPNVYLIVDAEAEFFVLVAVRRPFSERKVRLEQIREWRRG